MPSGAVFQQPVSEQNVISGLEVEACEVGVKLVMHPCFGLSGTIQAKNFALEVYPQARPD